MIENEKQYQVTKKWAERFKKAAKDITGDDTMSCAQRKGCESMEEDLKQQMTDYRNKPLSPS